MRSIIFNVVSTPTSDVTKISSSSSSTSSSTFDFPATARVIFEKKLTFVFSRPLSRVSFFPLEDLLKKTILHYKLNNNQTLIIVQIYKIVNKKNPCDNSQGSF